MKLELEKNDLKELLLMLAGAKVPDNLKNTKIKLQTLLTQQYYGDDFE